MVLLVMIVAAFIAVGLISYLVAIYNGLIVVKNNILKAWSNIDVLLKQRHDEIPKLIKICESYMKYEKDAFSKIIELRGAAMGASSVGQKAAIEGALTQGLHRLFALSENYPELKAQASFQQFQSRISSLEDQIADRREFYNDSVNTYNIRIESLPDAFIAGLMNLRPQEMFKVAENERQDVAVDIKVP